MLASNLVNIVLDVVFVVVLGWGVEGVAAGTAIAEWSAFFVGAALTGTLLKGAFPGRWDVSRIVDRAALKHMVSVNLDIFIRTLSLIGANLWFTNRGASIGDLALAANAVLLTFHLFSAFFLDGFAFAAESLVGEAKGARNLAQFRAAVRASTLWALGSALAYVVVYAAAGGLIIAALTDIEGVRAAARTYLPWVVILPLLSVWSFQLDGIFIGATRTVAMRNGMVISLAVFAPLALILTPRIGNHGLWLAYSIFMVVRAIALGVRYPALERSIEDKRN